MVSARIPTFKLIWMANREREVYTGQKLELCSITNAKAGRCKEDCKFCAQSERHRTPTPIYPLKDKETLLKEAERAKAIGAQRFGIVTSGAGVSQKELEKIIEAIQEIKRKVEIKLCASLGFLNRDSLLALKKAGLERYHHNIETSPEFFHQVVSTHGFEKRIKTIKTAKQVGLEVCSGGIIGLGETEEDRVRMASILKGLKVDSVPINILLPIPGTPYQETPPLSICEIIRAIAIFRLILEDRTIRIAAGRDSILKDFQGLAFMAGANAMIIGGYLTTKARDVGEDQRMVEEIKRLWIG